MNALHERLGAAVEADALRFTGDAFAGRFGAVRGRIARRRAARSAGIGGVSVLGVGMLSMGASHVPWTGFVFGTPASSPGVVCTTTTPEATIEDMDPAARTWLVETDAGSLVYEVYLDGEFLVVESNAGAERIPADDDGKYRFTLDGQTFEWESNLDGDPGMVSVDIQGDGNITTLPTVEPASPEPSPSPVVTCVTATPDPSASPSRYPAPVVSADPSVSPDPAVRDEFGDAPSPFQCGFEFDGDTDSDPLAEIRDAHWVTPEAAEAAVRAFFQDPDSVELNLSGDLVPVVTYDLGAGPEADSVAGQIGPQDPRGGLGGFASTDGVEDTAQFAAGAAFVLAQDGVVVATYVPSGGAMSQYIDAGNADTGTLRGLNVVDAFDTCSGSELAALGATDLYAVAGWILEDEHGVDGPRYAWLRVEPQS